VVDAALDMGEEDVACRPSVSRERASQQLLMFPRGDLASEHDGNHLIAKVFVIDRCVCLQQKRRPTGRDQSVVVVPIAALPEL
jgi:hypothetical protein